MMNGLALTVEMSLLFALGATDPSFKGWSEALLVVGAEEKITARVEAVEANVSKIEITNQRGQKVTYYVLRDDVMIKPVLGDCRLIGSEELGIIGFARHDEREEVLRDVRIAWRYSTKIQQLVSLDPKTVECLNESYGE